MLYVNHQKSVFVGLFLAVFLSSVSSNVLAKRHFNNTSNSCLSSKEFNRLAKSSLSDLQSIDPAVTLTDIKTVLKSAGDCATIEELNYALEQYSIDLASATSADNSTIEVVNASPVISGSPQSSISEGSFYIFTPTASDADGDQLSFSVQNLPDWAHFDASTGAILGVPMAADVGLYQDITIIASDGLASSSLNAISIEVTGLVSGMQSPLLSEIASYTVYMGTSADNLSSVINLDVAGGAEIKVNNTLPIVDTYYLFVVARDRDGNSMLLPNTEIAGYRIYIGTSMTDLNPVYNFSDGTDKVYWVNSLLAGTYYVSIATYDVNGNQTELSNIAQFDLI